MSNKKDNSTRAVGAKIELRLRALQWVGTEHANVFDAFAGRGRMWRGVWRQAGKYVGCDKRLFLDDARTMFCADNRRVLRSIELGQYNVFDLDSYGSSWEQALIIAARRPSVKSERLAIVMTIGERLQLNFGGMPKALKVLAGFASGAPCAARHKEEILDRAIEGLVRRMRSRLIHRWQADASGKAQMTYLTMALESSP